MAAFHFSGRTFVAGDRLKLPAPSVVPPGAGLIGLCRPTASNFFNRGFYSPGATSGWIMGRAPSNDRMGLYRPLRPPVVQASVGASAVTVTTPSFSPPANCILIAWSAVRDTVAPGTSNMVTSGLTWTLIPGADIATDDGTVFIRQRAFYTTIGASPPTNITVATTSTLVDHNACVVLAVPGGGTPIFQVATNPGTAGDATATFAAAPAANSIVLGSFHDRTFPSSITPPADYTQAGLFNVGTNGKLQIVYNENASSSAVAWVTAATGICTAIAIELRCAPLVEHSTATWQDDRVQSFLAFSQSASEHYLALNDAGSLQAFSTNIPIDATSALALGTFDMAGPRGGFVGAHFWIGVLKAMPPVGPLDQVLRQLQPPSILRPWLAHLFPLMGRSPERCILTNVALNVDAGTTLSNVGVPQPQVELEDGPFEVSTGASRRRVRVTARNATGDTVLTLDAGPSNQAAAIVVSLPAPAGTTGLGVACNGGALTTASLPSAAPAQQGELFVGTSILDGAAQVEAGSVRIGALAIGPAWTSSVHSAMWSIAGNWLRPVVDPIALVGESGTPYIEDLAARIKDPARAGYTLALSGISGGLTAAITGGTNLSWQAAANGDYGATLTITSLLSGLAPTSQVAISFAVGVSVPRYANGYRWRAYLRRPAWLGGGSETTLLLPFAELSQRFKTVANGGLVESAAGWDIRFEGAAGQIAHRLLGYDSVGGLAAILLNLEQDLSTTEQIAIYLGKADLLQSEENVALTRQGGWVAWHGGWGLQDLSNLGHTLSESGSVGDTAIGAWPAGQFNGSSSYRFRSSNELNAQSGFFVAALVQTNEAVGRSQEFLNIAPNDTAQLAMRLSATGNWVAVCNVGGQLLNITSDTGLYGQGEPHAFCVSWTSGQAPNAVLDGRVIEPTTPPPVATGATAMDETLEIGRGNRPPGTASYWNGFIGPTLMATSQQTQAQREIITAGLKEPRLVYGISDFQEVGDTAQPFVAMPLQGTAARGINTSFNVVANAYNPDGTALTVSVPAQPANVAATVAGGSVLVNPNNTAGNRVLVTYLLSSGTLSSSGAIDLSVGPVNPGGGTEGLPAGYPTPPTFAGAGTVNVSTSTEMQNAINGAPLTGAGRIIVAAGDVDYGTITVNRSTANIKIVCNTPRFSSLVTERSALDGTDLNVMSFTDAGFISAVVPGGLLGHTATALMNLNVTRCGILWIEGFDFHDPRRILVNRTSSTTDGVNQLWIRKCSFSEADTNALGIGGTSGRGADLSVVWECFFQADGSRSDPGSSGTAPAGSGVWTDYALQYYNCGDMYIYKTAFLGGWNHNISTKLGCDEMFVDDCVFGNWHPDSDSWKNFELGQEGSPTGNDRTCGMVTVRGCTFTYAVGTASFRVAMLKDNVGILFDGCLFYSSQGNILDILPAPNRNGPNDQGRLSGTGGMIIRNCRFGRVTLVTPRPVNLNSMYTGSGGGYVFRASNNQTGGTRAINNQNTNKISTAYGPNPGFSGGPTAT